MVEGEVVDTETGEIQGGAEADPWSLVAAAMKGKVVARDVAGYIEAVFNRETVLAYLELHGLTAEQLVSRVADAKAAATT